MDSQPVAPGCAGPAWHPAFTDHPAGDIHLPVGSRLSRRIGLLAGRLSGDWDPIFTTTNSPPFTVVHP